MARMQDPMGSSSRKGRAPAAKLGPLLRHWRDVRGKSQLDLSLDAGHSQRHISFVESGRSTPGRQTLLDIAQALDMPFRDRNGLLLAAGYAPIYPDGAWNAPEMESVTKALERVLHQHEPFPAVVMDRHWNVLMANRSAPRFFGFFIDIGARPGPRNMLRLMFDPEGVRPFIANWKNVARSLIERVHREAVGGILDEEMQNLLATLLAYPDAKAVAREATSSSTVLPMVPVSFVKDGSTLDYFSMVTTVGTPQTIAAQELRIECMFPANESTEARHHEMLGTSHPS